MSNNRITHRRHGDYKRIVRDRFYNVMPLMLILIVSCINGLCEGRTSPNLKVTLSHGGTLVGRHLTSNSGRHMRAFLGVPYAKPPLGELRFKSPVPYGSWKGDKLAIKDSSICIQRDPFRRDMEIEGNEDCLYINVYTPEKPHTVSPLPVMVWFHGGGWECGSGISGFYGPNYLMEHDIILVSANFRLGPLGFLSTETTDCPGNFGLKDQLEVLHWIQKNIDRFGGDPNSVTIFGESAGGASVTYHMLSEKSKGLFHKGIAQSGTYFNPWAQPAHKGVPAKRAHKLAQIVGCNSDANDWSKTLSCLRKKPAADIVATVYDLFEWDTDPMIPFPPVVEPQHPEAFLTVLPRSSKAPPHGFALPLMIGATSEEGLLKTAALLNLPGLLDEFKTKFDKVLPIILNYDHHSINVQRDITKKIEEFYFNEGHNYNKERHHNLTDLISDGWFIAGIDEYLRLRTNDELKTKIGPTYVYLFEHKGAASFSELFKGGREDHYGACHAEELQYLFPIGKELFVSAAPTERDIKLREAMTFMWVNFANSSNPTPPEQSKLPIWKPTKSYPVTYVLIGSKDEDDMSILRDNYELFQDRVNFWHKLRPHIPAKERAASKDEL